MRTHKRPAAPLRVFLAEDDGPLRAALVEALERDGHLVIAVSDGIQLMLDLVGRDVADPVVVVADARMPMIGGMPVLRALARTGRCPPFVLMTAFASPELKDEAASLGALAVLDKPFDFDQLRQLLRRVATRRSPPPQRRWLS